jgi:hypothetical protein
VSSFQKVSDFRIVNNQKQGGNVASYFCASDGRVLHVIPGPVDARTLLREARWVVETFKLAQLEGQDDAMRFVIFIRKAHADRLRQEYRLDGRDLPAPNYNAIAPAIQTLPDLARGKNRAQRLGQQAQAHLLLAAYPMPRIEQVYVLVFERILNQRLSTGPVEVKN